MLFRNYVHVNYTADQKPGLITGITGILINSWLLLRLMNMWFPEPILISAASQIDSKLSHRVTGPSLVKTASLIELAALPLQVYALVQRDFHASVQQYDVKSKCNNYNPPSVTPGEEYSFPQLPLVVHLNFSDKLWRLVSLHRLRLPLLHHIFIHGLFPEVLESYLILALQTMIMSQSQSVLACIIWRIACSMFLMQLLMIINMIAQVCPY